MTHAKDIDFNDLQGLVRFAHAQLNEARFLLLHVIDAGAARDWLRTAPVTTAANAKPLPEHALQVAFTASGLRALEVDESVIDGFSEEFVDGMVGDDNRSRRLGDVGNNNPGNWDWGGVTTYTPHLVLMLYAHPGGLAAWQNEIMGYGFANAFQLQTELKSTVSGPQEPFGFVDGISQPKIDWQCSISTDLHERDRYANLLAAGEVVLGYPNEYGLYTSRPLLDPTLNPNAQHLPVAEDQPELRDLGCNGTYLVLRQLGQDVPGFWQFIDRTVDSDVEQRDQLAAAMVGRQRDGTPLASPTHEPIMGIDNDEPGAKANKFTFDDDPHGQRCPIGAHIRRANPRTGDFPAGVSGIISRLIRILGFGRRHPQDDLIASARFHRILRRGRVYGSTLPPEEAVKSDALVDERGLQFVCLGANISRQFEFVQNAWAMSAKFAGLPAESDPLLGNREPLLSGEATDRFTLPQADGHARCIAGLPQFVTVRGGAYFFMPGIKALQFIASQPSKTE
jgi:deferrochelatase/peroxidase EfeB